MKHETNFDTPVAQVLRTALDLLRKKGWTQGSFYTKKKGYCALGAFPFVDYRVSGKAIGILRSVIVNGSIVEWNDKPKRTFAEVEAAFEEAIIIANLPTQAEPVPLSSEQEHVSEHHLEPVS